MSDNAETYGWAPAGPWGNGTQHGAVPSCANQYLMNDLARGEWGFDGYITSDCNAVNDVLGPSGGTRGKCLCCPPASIPWAILSSLNRRSDTSDIALLSCCSQGARTAITSHVRNPNPTAVF